MRSSRRSLILLALAACGGPSAAPTAAAPPAAVEAPPPPQAAPPAAPPSEAAPTEAAAAPPVAVPPVQVASAAPTLPVTPARAPTSARPAVPATTAPPAPAAAPSTPVAVAPVPAPATVTVAVPEAPGTAPAKPVSYTLTPTKGAMYVVVRHDPDTLMAAMGHDHVIGATGWHGSVTWRSDGSPEGCKVDLVVPVSGLQVDLDGLRTRSGLGGEGETSEDDKAKIKENLEGSKQLDAARFPEIRFVGRTCVAKGDKVAVTGDFTMHGVTRPLTVTLDVDASGDAFHARGSWKLNGSDFGFEPFKAVGGAIKNLDVLTFGLDVRGKPA